MRDASARAISIRCSRTGSRSTSVCSNCFQTAAERWGIEIDAVEIKDVDIPEQMQRAIAREAEAIREKRARIIKAEGENEAAQKLAEAATMIATAPGALELRRLQTLTEIGVEHNSTIIAMLPVELLHAAAKLAGMPREPLSSINCAELFNKTA